MNLIFLMDLIFLISISDEYTRRTFQIYLFHVDVSNGSDIPVDIPDEYARWVSSMNMMPEMDIPDAFDIPGKLPRLM